MRSIADSIGINIFIIAIDDGNGYAGHLLWSRYYLMPIAIQDYFWFSHVFLTK